MPVRVVVLTSRTSEAPLGWSTHGAWSAECERCALELLSSGNVGEERAEVYLCLSEDQRQSLDRRALEGFVKMVWGATWDADVYLVLNSRQALTYDPITQFEAVAGWFETALRSGIKDLLEVWGDGLDQIDPTLLRAARDRAAIREAVRLGLGPAARWRVVVPDPENTLGGFLEPFVHWQAGGSTEHRLILAVDQPAAARQLSRMRKDLDRYGPSAEVVATLGVHATQRLIDLCEERRLTLLRFLGPYELRYFLQRLNPHDETLPHRSRFPSPGGALLHGSVAPRPRWEPPRPGDLGALYRPALAQMMQSIRELRPQYLRALSFEMRLEDNLVRSTDGDTEALRAERAEIVRRLNELSLEALGTSFNDLVRSGAARPETAGPGAADPEKAAAGGAARAVLVTLALEPADEKADCLVAARMVGLIREWLPPGAEVLLHLSRMGNAVGDMLLKMPAPKIWIYLGQAGSEGLRKTAPRPFVAAAGWLAGVPPGAGNPSLALLLANRSEASARALLAAGVSCAIGCNGAASLPELEPALRILVQGILSEGTARRSVEKAGAAAGRALRACGLEESGLKTFFSEAT